MMDEDDTIVEEIPVFLSKSLVENMFVFQYPMKSMNTDFENTKVVNCCIKPVSKQIKIDFGLDTASTNYDSHKGEQFAIAADGRHPGKNERPTFQSGRMDKQSYLSSNPVANVDKYIVCILQDREVHASQINGIIQMRPTYNYFDKLDKRTKEEQKAENEADMEEEEAKQVTVQFSRLDTERLRKAREKTYEYISQKGSEEPWCEMLYHPKSSRTADLEKQKLISTGTDTTSHALGLNSKEYFDNLVVIDENPLESQIHRPIVPKAILRNMPLLDQIKNILKDAKVLTFNQVMEILDDKNITSDKVLRLLPLAGLLIRGNWVVQSEIIYPQDAVSGINGVSAELMCRGRDYILCKLSKGESINRRKAAVTTQLPPDEVLEILTSVAKINQQTKQWELLLPTDLSFESKYQELVQRQEMYWRAKEEKFNELEKEKSPKRARKKSVREPKESTSKVALTGS